MAKVTAAQPHFSRVCTLSSNIKKRRVSIGMDFFDSSHPPEDAPECNQNTAIRDLFGHQGAVRGTQESFFQFYKGVPAEHELGHTYKKRPTFLLNVRDFICIQNLGLTKSLSLCKEIEETFWPSAGA
eukprot:3525970-Amphidinium_carterae.1